MRLSRFFTGSEATTSSKARRKKLRNNFETTGHLVNAIHLAVYVLDPIREHYGSFTPNSWYRSAAVNRLVGGSKSSDHLVGRAADIEIKGLDNLKLAHWIKCNLEYDQLICENYVYGRPASGWVHVSFRLSGNRMQEKTFMSSGKTRWKKGLPDLVKHRLLRPRTHN